MSRHQTIDAGQWCFAGGERGRPRRGLWRARGHTGITAWSFLAALQLPTATLAQTPAPVGPEFQKQQGLQQGTKTAPPTPSAPASPPPPAPPLVLGPAAQTVEIPGKLSVGGGRVEVVTSPIGGGVLTSNLYIRQLNQAGSPAHLCWKVAPDGVPGLLLTTCTTAQSSLRYKSDLRPFVGGLDVITRLQPHHFTWKNGGGRGIGLIAEDVARVEPLFTFKNGKDEIEGVKYVTLGVVFINGFKEQQAQIEELRQLVSAQQEQLALQGRQLDALAKLISR